VSVHFNEPLTRNSTFVTPTLSVAFALMVTVLFLETIVPFRGEIIVTVGAMVSGRGVTDGIGVLVGDRGIEVLVATGVGVGVLLSHQNRQGLLKVVILYQWQGFLPVNGN